MLGRLFNPFSAAEINRYKPVDACCSSTQAEACTEESIEDKSNLIVVNINSYWTTVPAVCLAGCCDV